MLSIAVSFFHFSIQEFDQFTPVEFDLALYQNRLLEESKQTFFESQFRLINTFTFNSTPFLKKTVQDAQKLYPLTFEQDIKDRNLKKQDLKPFISKNEFESLLAHAKSVN